MASTESGNKRNSFAQSLFQIYYLGHTPVDRRCSSAVMPWVIEELKLSAEEMRLIWLSPGPEGVSYVANNGQEMFTHTYGSIVRCCIAVDGISFAYTAHHEKDRKYYCHAFQALTYDDASMIMQQFKENAKEEGGIPSSGDSEERFTEFAKLQSNPDAAIHRSACEYHLSYLGNLEVGGLPSPAGIIDKILQRMREERERQGRRRRRLKKKAKSRNSSQASLNSVDSVDLAPPASRAPGSTTSTSELSETSETTQSSLSSLGLAASEGQATSGMAEGEDDVAIRVTRATPEREEEEEEEEDGQGEEWRVAMMERISEERDVSEREDEGGEGVTKQTDRECRGKPQGGMGGVLELHFPQEIAEGTVLPETAEATGNVHREQSRQGQQQSSLNLHIPCPPRHIRQQSYETDEVSLQIAEQLSGDEGDTVPGMKRSVTVHSVGGSVVNTVTEDGHWDDAARSEATMEGGGGGTTTRGFDTLPELETLQATPEFQALGLPPELPGVEVKAVFSGLSVSVFTEAGGELVLRRAIRTISMCAQGVRESKCVGFISREGSAKKFHCHLFRAQSKQMASAVLESFKSSFVHALSVSQPAALCDTCPLQQLHDLCRSIEGVSTQVAQSRIQECMATLNDHDFALITRKYKESEHVDHEYTQLVVLLALLRQHFHQKQLHHTHTTTSQLAPSSSSLVANSGSKPLKTSALERAKMALASSFDNLMGRGAERRNMQNKRAMSLNQPENSDKAPEPQGGGKASQSINLPPLSPLFSRKSDFETLASPAQALPKGRTGQQSRGQRGEEGERAGANLRPRSESFRIYRRRFVRTSGDGSHSEKEDTKTRLSASDAIKPSPLSGSSDECSAPSSCSTSPQPSPPPSPPKFNLFYSHSFASSADFKTPTCGPLQRKPPYRRAQTVLPAASRHHTLTPHSSTAATPSARMGHRRSMSWRQDMFEQCATPTKALEDRRTSIQALVLEVPSIDQLVGRKSQHEGEGRPELSPRSRARDRWRRAIHEQLLLNRLEAANRSLIEETTEIQLKRLKLCYTDSSLNPTEAGLVWADILSQNQPSEKDVHKALLLGVPPSRRAEVWSYLVSQYQSRHGIDPDIPFATPEMLHKYCHGTTPHEHTIEVDLGRTFPSHPYFSDSRKLGQADLHVVLKGYAVADREIGYCQGLSFVAGMLLMHMKDKEAAYLLLCQLMHHYGYRDMYAEDLSSLQVRLYQLSRLIHDYLPDLSHHLRHHELPPFFYAASWFLTLFASQYPIAFVARVLDALFYKGPDFIFKVILALLRHHQDAILQCESMESTCVYLKDRLPATILDNMTTIFTEALQMDLGFKLEAFETEYQIMAELKATLQIDTEPPPSLETMNSMLKKQNRTLIEQLAICRGSIRGLEATVSALQAEVNKHKERIHRLEGL